MSQSHAKFKIFVSAPTSSDAISDEVLAGVSKYVAETGIAARSIGVEYVEGKEAKGDENIVLSLGYRDDEPGHPVKLECVSLGKLSLDPAVIGAAMEAAASSRKDVICHEFYVTDEREFFLVLMSRGE